MHPKPMVLVLALALPALPSSAFAEDGPRCINFTASTGTACSPGMNDAEIEGGSYFHRMSACPDTTLSTDGDFHCLEAKRRTAAFREAIPTDETVIVDPDGSATAANLMTNLDTTFGDSTATRFELNITGHAGQREVPPDGADLAINAFQPNDTDPSSFTASDLLARVGRNRTAIGGKPVAMTFDTCFSGTAVNQFANYVATTENPANICAIGASGEDEFSKVGSSLARVRMRLRGELDCEPTMNEVYRQAMRSDSMPSVPTLTSNALLNEYQRAKAGLGATGILITPGAIGAGIATLPCASSTLVPAPAPIESLGAVIEGVNQRLSNAIFTARITQVQGDALYLLRQSGITGCGTIAADGSNLDATMISCFSGRLTTQYEAARERLDAARDVSQREADAIKARYDRRENYLTNLFDEFLGLPHPERNVSNLGSGGQRAIQRAFARAKAAIIARRRERTVANGGTFTGRDRDSLVERDSRIGSACGGLHGDFGPIGTCINDTPAGTPSRAACTSVRDTEIRTRVVAAGCASSSPHRSNPAEPSPREACETAARTAAETDLAACQQDCQERYLNEFSPCRLALEPVYTQFKEEMRTFLDSEKVAEAAAVNLTFGREITISAETKKIRRAAEQLEVLGSLRTLANDRSAIGRRFQELYVNTSAGCEGFDPRTTATACIRED